MPNGKLTWTEWQNLTDDQKDFKLYEAHAISVNAFSDHDARLVKLESRKRFDTTIAGSMGFIGGFAGGFAAMLGRWFIGK